MNWKALYIFTMKQFNIESYFLESSEECFHKTIWFGSGLVWENGSVILKWPRWYLFIRQVLPEDPYCTRHLCLMVCKTAIDATLKQNTVELGEKGHQIIKKSLLTVTGMKKRQREVWEHDETPTSSVKIRGWVPMGVKFWVEILKRNRY